MTNRLWVTLCIVWKAVTSPHLFLWQKASEWNYIFCEGSLIISFTMTNREWVTFPYLVKGNLMTSFPMNNSLWVTSSTFCAKGISWYEQQGVGLHILTKAASSHPFLWPWIGSVWHCMFWTHRLIRSLYDQQYVSAIAYFCERQSDYIFSYDQQRVSDISKFCESQSDHIFSYDKQVVSDIAHFVKGSQWHDDWSHPFIWPIASEWHRTFGKDCLITSLPMTNSKWVTYFIFVVITSSPTTNSLWVTLHFVKGSLITSFLKTNREYVATFYECNLITTFHDQQIVSSIAHCVKQSLQSFPMTNSK